MANTAAKKNINAGIESRNKIKECIKAHGSAITKKDISEETGLTEANVAYHLHILKSKQDPDIVFDWGKLSWKGSEGEKQEEVKAKIEKPERYPEHKTDEGYNDYTAGRVVKTMDDATKGVFKPGDVWTVNAPNGRIDHYLIVASFDKCVSCLFIQEIAQSDYNPVIHALVSMGKKEVVDCRRVTSKPSRYFLEKDPNYNVTNFDAIKRKIGCLLDISAPEAAKPIVKTVYRKVEVPVEVVKEVEKRVEVPVEVIKEVPVEKRVEVPVEVVKEVPTMKLASDDMELALAKQKADIYERITWAMLVNMGQNMEEHT